MSSEPLQAFLSRDTDMSKTEDTRRVIEGMVRALNDHRIDDIGEFFADDFVWRGNTGCGVKHGIKDFQDNWQRPFQAAFSGKRAIDEARLVMGEWAASFGAQHAVHSGSFMGVPSLAHANGWSVMLWKKPLSRLWHGLIRLRG